MMMQTFSRKLGDSELSYFLPSREDGVNDMYLHIGFRAPPSLVNPHRVALAWAILRLRHPLLSANVVMEPGEYDSARFVYTPPVSPASVLHAAESTLQLKNAPKDALIDAYLNGPRTLSNECVSVLILSSSHFGFPQELHVPGGRIGVVTPPQTPRSTTAEFDLTSTKPNNPCSDEICEFDLLFCAAHFLGDGIALHTCVNDLFTLLAGPVSFGPTGPHSRPSGDPSNFIANSNTASGISVSASTGTGSSSGLGHSASLKAEASASCGSPPLSDTALHALLEIEWSKRWASSSSSLSPARNAATSSNVESVSPLPLPLECRLSNSLSILPSPLSAFQRVAHNLAFRRAQERLIGGHAFARVPKSPPHSDSDSAVTKEANVSSPAPAASNNTEIPQRQCHTLVRTVAFPPLLTRRMLKRCKEEGVSVAHVLFALCNVAWGRVGGRGNGSAWEMPMMMYSALNLRPYLTPPPSPSLSLRPEDASYWFLAVGYFNVVLPSFILPPDDGDAVTDASTSSASARKTLFHRARLSKRQCASAAKTPLLSPYAQIMARERGARAKRFAWEDDELDSQSKGTGGDQMTGSSKKLGSPTPEAAQLMPSPPTTPMGTRASSPPLATTLDDSLSLPEKLAESLPKLLPSSKEASTSNIPESLASKETAPPATTASPKPPSTALLGLSLLGNLDTMYNHTAYAPLTLHTLTTGSRQRAGALLLFGYTFAGRLWVSLGWDGATFGGERGGEKRGEGTYSDAQGVVWEGLGSEEALKNKREKMGGNRSDNGIGMVSCEGEVGRWWREVVRGVGEFFGEE